MNDEAARRSVEEKLRRCHSRLRRMVGGDSLSAGTCLLLGRYYGRSRTVYFSLNPGVPRSGQLVSPASTGEWNVPFHNPPALLREYVYLLNCQRFFETYPELGGWIRNGITSAFLIPWRTRTLAEVEALDQATGGQLLHYSGVIARQVVQDHGAERLVVAGKAAVVLLGRLNVLQSLERTTPVLGPGGSYQWSKWRGRFEGRWVTVLQIPHFSRANSREKMRLFAEWLSEEVLYSRVMEQTDEIRARLEARRDELQGRLGRHETDGRDTGAGEVQDEIDRVTSEEAKTATLEIGTIEYNSLAQVEEALKRLDDGTYGTCVVCGEPIEPARLRAIPETPYCIRDAEALEKEREQAGGDSQILLDS
jgi:DnaK suppressor protein